MQLKNITLKDFRCFAKKSVAFNSHITLIQGNNGKGKTSLLEALYYGCYLRSFKSRTPKDLIHFGSDGFFIKIEMQDLNSEIDTHIQIGFLGSKRVVRVNKKIIASYKELVDHYRVVCITEDDLNLIKEGPLERRSFLDQAILLQDPSFGTESREFRVNLENRNQFILSKKNDADEFLIWTERLWNSSLGIQKRRISFIEEIEKKVNPLLKQFGEELSILLHYSTKKMVKDQNFSDFFSNNTSLFGEEIRYGRSLFGAHLDDMIISWEGKKSRDFSSRGQQKLIVLLIKIAQISLLKEKLGTTLFLLDDFMTDFDESRTMLFLDILIELGCPLIFTSPAKMGFLESELIKRNAQIIQI